MMVMTMTILRVSAPRDNILQRPQATAMQSNQYHTETSPMNTSETFEDRTLMNARANDIKQRCNHGQAQNVTSTPICMYAKLSPESKQLAYMDMADAIELFRSKGKVAETLCGGLDDGERCRPGIPWYGKLESWR